MVIGCADIVDPGAAMVSAGMAWAFVRVYAALSGPRLSLLPNVVSAVPSCS